MVKRKGMMRLPVWLQVLSFFCIASSACWSKPLMVSCCSGIAVSFVIILYETLPVSSLTEDSIKQSGSTCVPSIINGFPSLKIFEISKLHPSLTQRHSYLYLSTTSLSSSSSLNVPPLAFEKFSITYLTTVVYKIFEILTLSAS